jgi:hypothetical protein
VAITRAQVAHKNGLTDKAPLRLHLRIAFHDWMWMGGSRDECGFWRRLCRRLPEYFSDPYMDGMPRTLEEFDVLEPEPTVGPPTGPFRLVRQPVTTHGSGVTLTFTHLSGP